MISVRPFGKFEGKEVPLYTLSNGTLTAELFPCGAALRSLLVPDRQGDPIDVVLGYDTLEEYRLADGYLGASVGRFANRIGNARFTLNGREYRISENEPPNHLHGGFSGFDKKLWETEAEDDHVTFRLLSPDGDEGYPGNLSVAVTYTLEGSALIIDYCAKGDADTPVSLTNHSYFNLSGQGSPSLADHFLTLCAEHYTPTNKHTLPTGEIAPVKGTALDFTAEAAVIPRMETLKNAHTAGFDHSLILSSKENAARLISRKTGISMAVSTTLPGIQLYGAGFLSPRTGKGGAQYVPHSSLCLETQHVPDSVNRNNFPSPILKKGEEYRHRTVYRFGAE